MKSRINDNEIKNVMSSIKTEIPEELDVMINEMLRREEESQGSCRSFFTEMNPFIKWSPVFVSAILLIVIGFFQLRTDIPDKEPVKEIRIEYEVKDKNIKILWVKKAGFVLKRRTK